MLRHVTERDYGLDCIVEITLMEKGGTASKVVGWIFALQVKAVESLVWRQEGSRKTSTISGIGTSTVQYWMNLPMPVFLFVHDRSQDRVFFTDVKREIRRDYLSALRQKTMSFPLDDFFCLNSKEGQVLLFKLFDMESRFDSFADHLMFLLLHRAAFDAQRAASHDKPANEIAPDEEIAVLLSFLRACQACYGYLLREWSGPTVDSIWIREGELFGDMELRYGCMAWAYDELVSPYENVVTWGRRLVTDVEHVYWLQREPFLVRACYSPEERERQRLAREAAAAKEEGGRDAG